MCNPIPIVRSGWILRHALRRFQKTPLQNSAKTSLESLVPAKNEIEKLIEVGKLYGENLSKNEPMPCQNSDKALDSKKENLTKNNKADTKKEIAPDEVLQKVKTGEISINKAYTTIKRQENEENVFG